MSWIRDRFKISFSKKFRDSHSQAFACTLISCCSIVNDLRGSLRFTPRFARPDYYTTLSPVCQEVFEKFFKFFSKSFQPLLPSGEEVPEYYITSLFVCQEVFQKFFQLFSWFLFLGCPRGYPLVDSLHIIALLFPFVNRFLQSFLSLELWAGLYKDRASRLCNLPYIS